MDIENNVDNKDRIELENNKGTAFFHDKKIIIIICVSIIILTIAGVVTALILTSDNKQTTSQEQQVLSDEEKAIRARKSAEIDRLHDQLYSSGISDEERQEILDEIDELHSQ